jgi:DNA-binding beta-propeller fold protein YncE
MLSRRRFIFATAAGAAGLPACRRKASGYSGFAFIANQEGQAVAAVDLESFTVARHIHLDGAPSEVVANPAVGRVYALTSESGTVHEIRTDALAFSRKLQVAQSAVAMRLSRDSKTLVVLCSEPKRVAVVAVEGLRVISETPLAATPTDLDLSEDGRYIAVSYGAERAVSIIRIDDRRTAGLIRSSGDIGAVRFRGDSKVLIAADLTRRMLSVYDVAARGPMVDLPLVVRPDQLCFTRDGGQLFVTGEGGDAVVIVFPYYTPEVAETVPAGHSPGAMATSTSPAYLFIANPKSGDVTILDIDSRRLVAVTPAGTNPNYIAITPDNNYALVLNETSGDMAVIRMESLVRAAGEPWRSRRGAPFMMIPVGSKPVSAVVMPI